MAQAIYFHNAVMDQRIFFTEPKSRLPVLTRSGTVTWISWGRHKRQVGKLPLGGWAQLDQIQAGSWSEYFPQPVKIPAQAFMEQDFEGDQNWFPLIKGQCIQGLIAKVDYEIRVYVVTIVPGCDDAMYSRWPRIVQAL